MAAFLAAFPDLQATIEDQIAECDRVVTRLTWHGTHRRAFQGISLTGFEVYMPTIRIDRMAGNRIADNWVIFDALGLMPQLGALPASD